MGNGKKPQPGRWLGKQFKSPADGRNSRKGGKATPIAAGADRALTRRHQHFLTLERSRAGNRFTSG
jgi:hypothetical protein